jgi:mono/diheme cytochrome c family protein
MMAKRAILIYLAAMMAGLTYSTVAQQQATGTSAEAVASTQAQVASNTDASQKAKETSVERTLRLEGEKRFRTNCGRCHQPPHKFPPRVMAAAIRHMRVRAMITDEDMRLILRYMAQ